MVADPTRSTALVPRRPLHGWGLHPVIEGVVLRSENLERITQGAVLTRGLGRAYGDAALPPAHHAAPVAGSTLADRILSFDPDSGLMRAEAGLSLRELRRLYLPRGWFVPVTPGTQYVTLGGMVAADVHGKNHHVDGTFGAHVQALRLRVAEGRVLEVSRDQEPELFRATLGGMGLTGHVLEVAFRMHRVSSPWIYEETSRYSSLKEVFHALNEGSRAWPMTVAWVDTSARGAKQGRGIVMCGRWATPDEAPDHAPPVRQGPLVPFFLPSGLLNPTTVRWANALWYLKHGPRNHRHVVHPEAFFYVLDLAREWNRAYGRRGFTQYQCVMPSSAEIYAAFLERFQRLGGCSFVTVFKDCGDEGEGLLSFPQRGTSMALDIPLTADTPRLIRELNAYVIDHGGRVYLAKDALTTGDEFERMYPRLGEFQAVRDRWDPQRRLRSALSVRLMGDPVA